MFACTGIGFIPRFGLCHRDLLSLTVKLCFGADTFVVDGDG